MANFDKNTSFFINPLYKGKHDNINWRKYGVALRLYKKYVCMYTNKIIIAEVNF